VPECVSRVVYESEETSRFDRTDWIGLALAALDQAGVTPAQMAAAYRHARGRINGVFEELDCPEATQVQAEPSEEWDAFGRRVNTDESERGE
jgi:hypothetical protein